MRLAAATASVAALAAAALLWSAAPASSAPRSPLSHEGRWITDASGRVVILHGWNMVNKLPPYHPRAIGFGLDDARFLARHGFNTVRLGIIHKGLEPEPGRYDRRYLRAIARTTRVLRRRGIQVLLDFHQDMYNERFNGEGEPDWAVVGDAATLPPEPDQGFPANYLIMPALWRAYDHFWENSAGPGGVGLQDRYAAAWRRVAKRFRRVPEVLGYNLFNEPWPGSQWPTCAQPAGCPLADARLEAFHERVIAGIREADRRKIVWYAPHLTFDFGAATHHGDTGDPRAGFAFNMYCLAFAVRQIFAESADLGALEDQGCALGYDLALDGAEAQSEETGDALLMTEFGATDDVAVIDDVVELADERMISWQQWAYFNEDPCCERPTEGLVGDPAQPPRSDNLARDKLRVSERAYPQVTAGTPLRYRFNPDPPRFEMTYSTVGPGGRRFAGSRLGTQIYLPRIHFGKRYEVSVRGAKVVSRRRARVLRLRNRARTERVRVIVTPS